MALRAKYQQYLAHPSEDAFAPNASLHYVSSLTSICEPAAIIRHLKAQEQQLKTKSNFLNAFESHNSLCVEAETTLQFEEGGGTYLPGLEEYLLFDKVVTLPVVSLPQRSGVFCDKPLADSTSYQIHVVTFDDHENIHQIRLNWDQGSLLKAVEVIGSRGKGWPLRDGKSQAQLISASNEASPSNLASAMNGASLGEKERTGRRRSRIGGANIDKQNSHSLFDSQENAREDSPATSVAPRASARPPQRDYQDLFADGAYLPEVRDGSPTKVENRNPLKAGAGKHYTENRLFSEEPSDRLGSPEKSAIKTHPKKYNHFEFGEEDMKADPSKAAGRNMRHNAQWNFEDFVTPEKPKPRRQPQQERHFGWSDDEEEARKPLVHIEQKPKPRRDAAPQFDFDDEPTPTAERVRPHEGNGDLGLHEDHISKANAADVNSSAATAGPAASEKMPLGNITNVNKGHDKVFGSQWEMADESPSALDKVKDENLSGKGIPESRKKAVNQGMQANWAMYDDSPKDEGRYASKAKGIHISGDGMGGKKNTGEKGWWEL